MPRINIVVADAVRARFFTFDGEHVIEQADLLNPERRLKASELFTESRPPLGHSSYGQQFAVDDHREQHVRELDQRFAANIVKRIDAELEEHPAPRVVVAAGPHMLGILREALSKRRHRDIELDDLALDLTRESPAQLHDHLARMGFVRPRARRAATRSQRGW
jgi:protein required for attachment to host cells